MGVIYIAKREGFKPITCESRKLAQNLVLRGWVVEVHRDGKKIYTMVPAEKE